MGCSCSCERLAAKNNVHEINTERKHCVRTYSVKCWAKVMRNDDTNIQMITTLIDTSILTEEKHDFDTDLFYCWITGAVNDANTSRFQLNLHIHYYNIKCFYTFTTTYNKIKEIYSSAYNIMNDCFPQQTFPDLLAKGKKILLMKKYMILHEIKWENVIDCDVNMICDLLIKLFNSPLFIIQKNNDIFSKLEIDDRVRDLLRNIANKWINNLEERSKENTGHDEKQPLYQQELQLKFDNLSSKLKYQCYHTNSNDLRFHTVSLAERPNNGISTHWGLKFEGNEYLLSLDYFADSNVHYQILRNDACGQRIFWYSWIGQTQFVKNWTERLRIPNQSVSFSDIGYLVFEWKNTYNGYHRFSNNCQHFARDLISVFKPNAAKILTDDFKNLFLGKNMTLSVERKRIDKISKILKSTLDDIYKDDEVRLWLTNTVGLPQYYNKFKNAGIYTLATVHQIDMDMLQEITDNIQHQQRFKKYVKALQPNQDKIEELGDGKQLLQEFGIPDKYIDKIICLMEEEGYSDPKSWIYFYQNEDLIKDLGFPKIQINKFKGKYAEWLKKNNVNA